MNAGTAPPRRPRSVGRRCLPLVALLFVFCALAPAAAAKPPAVVSLLAQQHPYRHGVVPPRGEHAASSPLASANNLSFGGGISGVGVTTGAPRVYVVFWGTQWGGQSTSSQGYATFTGDPRAMAPRVQAFFAGLGTAGETWSGVMTQYCQGVTTGAQSCPASNTQHVGYPTGGALAGVWEDASAAAPAQASAHQIALEAVAAATDFGNTTQASNRNVQYDIVSPTGTNPDGFNTSSGQFCAWHATRGTRRWTAAARSAPPTASSPSRACPT